MIDHAFVVPAWGEPTYLDECLASLRAQDVPGTVVVTTSSPGDALMRIAARHSVPVRVNPVRAGIASDWNFALTATDAALVTLAHQDDRYEPGYRRAVLDAVRVDPDVSMVQTDHRQLGPDGPLTRSVNLRVKRALREVAFRGGTRIDGERRKESLLLLGNPVCCPSVAIHRARVPDFRFAAGMRSNLDWAAWLALARRPGVFHYVRRPLTWHRVHAGSETSATLGASHRQREDVAMFDLLWGPRIGRALASVYRLSYRGNRT